MSAAMLGDIIEAMFGRMGLPERVRLLVPFGSAEAGLTFRWREREQGYFEETGRDLVIPAFVVRRGWGVTVGLALEEERPVVCPACGQCWDERDLKEHLLSDHGRRGAAA